MRQVSEKITVSLPKDTLRIADDNRERLGFHTRSDFIDAAIKEYVSRDLLKEFSGELTQLYSKIERSEIRNLEEHLAKLSYKIAVELAQINLLLADLSDYSFDRIRRLRGKAVTMVDQSKGYISLRAARKAGTVPEIHGDARAENRDMEREE